jgi:predicted transcriptional regulator of viral defense system
MRSIGAFRRLREPGVEVLDTADAGALLGIGSSHASRVLERLAEAGHIVRLKRGVWAFPDRVDPLRLPEYLTAPLPCYVSLQSALFYHGMISQVPRVVYAVSPARTRCWVTPLGTVSVHHLTPAFFTDFDSTGKNAIKMASPEKALIDCLYLGRVKSRLFASLPEVELPRGFNIRKARRLLNRIPCARLRTFVSRRLETILAQQRQRDRPEP